MYPNQVIARQVSGTGQASSSTKVRINVVDVNDNVPEFSKPVYQTEIYENITADTSIIRVREAAVMETFGRGAELKNFAYCNNFRDN